MQNNRLIQTYNGSQNYNQNNNLINNNNNINQEKFQAFQEQQQLQIQKLKDAQEMKYLDRLKDKSKLKDLIIPSEKITKKNNKQELEKNIKDKWGIISNSNNNNLINQLNGNIKNQNIQLWQSRTNMPYKNIIKDDTYIKKFLEDPTKKRIKDDLVVHKVTLKDKEGVEEERINFTNNLEKHNSELKVIYSTNEQIQHLKKFEYNHVEKYKNIKYNPNDHEKLKQEQIDVQELDETDKKKLTDIMSSLVENGIITKEEITKEEITKEEITKEEMNLQEKEKDKVKEIKVNIINNANTNNANNVRPQIIKNKLVIGPPSIQVNNNNNNNFTHSQVNRSNINNNTFNQSSHSLQSLHFPQSQVNKFNNNSQIKVNNINNIKKTIQVGATLPIKPRVLFK